MLPVALAWPLVCSDDGHRDVRPAGGVALRAGTALIAQGFSLSIIGLAGAASRSCRLGHGIIFVASVVVGVQRYAAVTAMPQ